jgi:hypothetical protein
MVTIIWGVNGFLPDNKPYNSEYFVKHILNRLHEMKADIWDELRKGLLKKLKNMVSK